MSSQNLEDSLKRAVFYEKNLQKVKDLISAGANVHTDVVDCSEIGSLLHRCQDAPIVRELLLNGVSVNRSNNYRETPLHLACSDGNTEVVKVLLEFGAWVDVTDRKGNTPLNKAVKHSYKNLETIKILLKYGADINIRNREKRLYDNHNSPLDNSIGELSIAKLLIKMYLIKNFNERQKINLEPYTECRNYSELIQYFDDSISEIIQMKREMVNQQTSLYDVVTKVSIDLSGNNEWVKKMKDIMTERYSIYHDIVAERIEICTERWKLLIKLRELTFFTELESTDSKITKIVLDPGSVHIIAKYLSTQDLSNLVTALNNAIVSCGNFNSNSKETSTSDKRMFPSNDFSDQAFIHDEKRVKLD